MKLLRNPFFYLTFVLAIGLGFLVWGVAQAQFQEPSQPFPGGNPNPPLDTSGVTQTKPGILNLGSLGFAGAGGGLCVNDTAGASPITCRRYGFDFGWKYDNGSGNIYNLNSDNVGIGTNTPAYTLDVAGDISLTGDIYQNGVLFTSGGESNWTLSGNSLYASSTSWNVGIGTDAPVHKLDVLGDLRIGGPLNQASHSLILGVGATDYYGSPSGLSASPDADTTPGGDASIQYTCVPGDATPTPPGTWDDWFQAFDEFDNPIGYSSREIICVIDSDIYRVNNAFGTVQFTNVSNIVTLSLGQDGTLNVGPDNFVVDSSGNVSFTGTLTNGSVPWARVTNVPAFITAADTITGLVQSTAAGNSYFTGGNIGIGTISPNHALEINGVNNGLVYLSTGTAGDDINAGLELRANNASAVVYVDFTPGSTDTAGSGTPDYGGRIIYNSEVPDGFSFRVNGGGSAVAIDQFGKVGIGNSTPSYTLDVAGVIRTSEGGAYDAGGVYFGYHSLNSRDDNWLYLGDESGTVPGARGLAVDQLKVYTEATFQGSSYFDGSVIVRDSIFNDSGSLKITSDVTMGGNVNVNGNIDITGEYLINNVSLQTGYWNPSGSDDIYYDAGKVGIGTASLGIDPLEVAGTAGPSGSGLLLSSNDVAIWGETVAGTRTRLLFLGSNDYTFINAPAGKGIRFRIADSDKVTIDSAGNVGIGTMTPQAELDVNGWVRTSGLRADTIVVDNEIQFSDGTTQSTAGGGGPRIASGVIYSGQAQAPGGSVTNSNWMCSAVTTADLCILNSCDIRKNDDDKAKCYVSRSSTNGRQWRACAVAHNDTDTFVQSSMRCMNFSTPGTPSFPSGGSSGGGGGGPGE